jgi:S1-C subfamily serine protease
MNAHKFYTLLSVGVIGLSALLFLGKAVRADEVSTFQKQAVDTVLQLNRNCSGTVVDIGVPSSTYILTANHCTTEEAANDAQRGMVSVDEKVHGKLISTELLPYDVVVRDTAKDLAIVKVRKEGLFLPTAKIAKEDPREGEQVWTIGYPLGLTRTVTEGRMGDYEAINKDMTADNFGDAPDGRVMYRATPALYGGNSGGGFFIKRNDDYLLVGVSDAGFRQFFVAGYYVTQSDVNDLVGRAFKKTAEIEQKKAND